MKLKRIKIRGYHCDSYGHINNARYLELLEEARWDALEEAMKSGFFEQKQLLFIVVNINISYRSEVKPNQTVEIQTSLKEYGRKSITFFQEIVNLDSGKTAVDALVKFVLLHKQTKQMYTVDDELLDLFSDWEHEN